MGGNAFNYVGLESKRMTLEKYNEVLDSVFVVLDKLDVEGLSIPYVREKESFGDIDIIIVKDDGECAKSKIVNNVQLFGVTSQDQVYNNGDVLSILYDGLYQVDFIFTPRRIRHYHRNYLSHNDLGNLIGRVIKESGFQHGHNGLFYVYREGNHYKELIELTTDYDHALNILGLDVNKFHQGFDTYVEMFEYVKSCKYFKRSRFDLKNLNNRNRVRDRKRKVYNMFIEYIKDVPESNELVPSPFDEFPWLEDRINLIKQQRIKLNAEKERFNGRKVHEWTGLSGRDGRMFGKFLEYVRNQNDYDEIVLNGSVENIEQYVKGLYDKFKEIYNKN